MLLRCLSGGSRRQEPWREREGAGRVLEESSLRKRLVLDGRCRDDQVTPFLRVIAKALLTDTRSHERSVRSLRR